MRTTTAGGVAAALIVAWPLAAAGPGGALEIHFIDVGQGDATLLRSGGRVEGSGGAADLLAVNPHTLRSRMRRLGIDWARFRTPGSA